MKNAAGKMNNLFLVMVVLYLLVSLGLSLLSQRMMGPGVVASLIIGELIVLVPGIVFLLFYQCDIAEWIPIKKVGRATIGFTFLLTFLIQPVLYFLNVLSQVFEKNVALDLFSRVEDAPGIVLFLVIGLMGPVCEEVVFRGILFSGYRKSGRIFFAILWTALLFGLFHMNLNQFGYAMMIGLVSAFLVEATGSLIPSLILHVLINSINVIQILSVNLLYDLTDVDLSELSAQTDMLTPELLLRVSALLLLPALICAALCVVVLIAISKREGTTQHLKAILPFGKKAEDTKEPPAKGSVLSVTGILGAAICLFMVFALERILQLISGQ